MYLSNSMKDIVSVLSYPVYSMHCKKMVFELEIVQHFSSAGLTFSLFGISYSRSKVVNKKMFSSYLWMGSEDLSSRFRL